ncbi:MAG: hypothetical protein ABR887_04345 [Methanoregulaceae archaeon]
MPSITFTQPHIGTLSRSPCLSNICINPDNDVMEELTLWCMDNEAVDKAREKDPKIGLIPCKGPDCPRYEGGRCILICRVGEHGSEYGYATL